MIARIVCYFQGHKRGKPLEGGGFLRTYQCPRCKATWKRKVKLA